MGAADIPNHEVLRKEVLRVSGLTSDIATPGGRVKVVDGISFGLRAGATLGLVGESGSGKSMTCLSILNLLPAFGRVTGGSVLFKGEDLATKSADEMRKIRGGQIGMILQDPMTSLNPLYRIGDQIGEVFKYHHGERSKRSRWQRAIDVMKRVHIPAPAQRAAAYPHQFSGGMRQRISIAINVACQPDLLIADEPTTALDVTIRQQILRLLKEIQRERGTAIILVTHDLHTVSKFCDEVAIMYAGRIVEQGPVARIFARPAHPYTRGLLDATPKISADMARLQEIPGQPPAAGQHGSGCRFASRCTRAAALCRESYPPLAATDGDGLHQVACWYPLETAA
ncbi:ABC transporter ATP-binding protein [Herbaspirillum sp. NPDC101396]|uniref:ABC transporter ATP-binding protein n=1 Tax=Herbaspirillum sp. NPDC101396 TaxID=3364005 RepID=UPI00383A08A1